MIVVIVIIGILAAIAMPRFIALQKDARAAKVLAHYGAISSAAMLANARCEVDLGIGKSGCEIDSNGGITMEGVRVQMVYKYPGATYAGIDLATNLFTSNAELKDSGFKLDVTEHGGGGPGVTQKIILIGATNEATCYIRYTSATSLTAPPDISFNTAGC